MSALVTGLRAALRDPAARTARYRLRGHTFRSAVSPQSYIAFEREAEDPPPMDSTDKDA
jgi:hypothetical protein